MSVCRSILRICSKKICIYILTLLLPLALLPLGMSPSKESRCAFVMLIVAFYWLLEPVPIAATALLPVFLFPLLGVMSSAETSQNYMKDSFMMFIGGLIIAIAVEDSKLHERIALKILLLIGTEMKWLMLGFMLTTMTLSMWVSNTATTAMMVPIVLALIEKINVRSAREDLPLEDRSSLTESKQVYPEEEPTAREVTRTALQGLKSALMLSICYSANIGGTGTLTGTGANLVFKGMVEELYPNSNEITYASWMLYCIPAMLMCIVIGWFYLWLVYIKCSKTTFDHDTKTEIQDIISSRYKQLGSITSHEAIVMTVFPILVILWVFRDPKFISGWESYLASGVKIGDSAPAIAIPFLLFMLPSNLRDWSSRPVIDWKTVQTKLPWGVLLLTGGGFALADGAKKSGLSELVGEKLSTLDVFSPFTIVTIVCFMTALITEIVSNITAATILLPVLSQMAMSIGVNPLYLMLPATLVCSYAFMLPVATPPNAIVYASSGMETIDMVKPGIVMNLVCCGVQLFMINTLGVALFDLNSFPEWASTNMTPSNGTPLKTFSVNSTVNFNNTSLLM